MVKDLRYAWIVPYRRYCIPYLRVQRLVRIWIHRVFHNEVAILIVFGVLDSNLKLSHRANQCLRAVNHVLVDRVPVERELVHSVAILVNDLHLLDDSTLSALAGTYAAVSA